EMTMLRRAEELRRRVEGGEIGADDFSERDIAELVRRVQSGEKPKAPESLSEWLRKQRGGIYDPNGELAAVYPDLARIPGLLRKSRKGTFNPRGGDSLDDVVLRA